MIVQGIDAGVHFSETHGGIAFSTVQPTRVFNNNNGEYAGQYIPWGENNLYPQELIATIEKNDILPAVLDFKTRALTSGGMQYGHIYHENGKDHFEPLQLPEIDDFLDDIEVDNYLSEATHDYYQHANFFPEVILNVGRKAVGLHCNDAAFTRLGTIVKTGSRKGTIDKVYISADWEHTIDAKNAEVVTAVDPYFRVADQIRQGNKYKYVIPSRAFSSGRLDYNRGLVDTLIASKWLDVDCSIPIWIDKIMNKQLAIQYHIEVDENYWRDRWKDWDTFDENKKSTIKREIYAKFIKFFGGLDSSGNVLFTEFKREHKEEFSRWKVTMLDTKAWDKGYIEQSTQSSAHIVTSQGVDSSLIPLIPGKGFTAGSGSDKRVAFNQHVLLCQPHQRKILRPFDYIADLNGWNQKYGRDGARLKFWFKNTFIATLDHGIDTKPANDNNMKKT